MNRAMAQSVRARRGFTLVELVIAMAIMTLLVGAMGSAVVLASRALPDPDDLSRNLLRGQEVVGRIETDLLEATGVGEAEAGAITVVVPDRGYDADGDETIRYAWSGKAGDPLTLEVNGKTAATLCEDVHAFSLEYGRSTAALDGMPKVLMAIESVSTFRSETRIEKLQSWGFEVETMGVGTPTSEIPGLIEAADVVYITRSLMFEYSAFEAKLDSIDAWASTTGVVSDQPFWTYNFYKLATGSVSWSNEQYIKVVNATHPITSPLSTGWLAIYSSYQDTAYVSEPVAPGLVELADIYGRPSIAIVDLDAELVDGSLAAGRRVILPYDGFTYDPRELNDDGWLLLRRALAWAAEPVQYTHVTLTVQVGSDASQRVVRRVSMLNTPGAS